MFDLASMVVKVKAQDAPFQAAINGLKSQIASVSASLGSQVGGAFLAIAKSPVTIATSAIGGILGTVTKVTGALSSLGDSIGGGIGEAFSHLAGGPVGLATEAVTGLFKILNSGAEEGKGALDELVATVTSVLQPEIDALKEHFEASIEPIKGYVAGLAAKFTEFVGNLKKSYDENSETIQRFGQVVADVFGDLKTAVNAGVEYVGKLRDQAIPAFNSIVATLKQIPNSINAAFGGDATGKLQSWGSTLQEWVLDKVDLAGVLFRNWPTFLEIAAIKIYEKIINIGEYFATIPANAQLVGQYLAGNWRQLAVDAVSAVGVAFANLGDNLKGLSQAIVAFVQNPTGGFSFTWKPLLDGFKATADKLPELIRAKLTTLDTSDLEKKIGELEAARQKPAREAAAAAAETKKVAANTAEAASGDKFKSQTLGVADFATKLRENIFSSQDNTPKQQLEAQQRIAAAAEQTAQNTKKKPGLGP